MTNMLYMELFQLIEIVGTEKYMHMVSGDLHGSLSCLRTHQLAAALCNSSNVIPCKKVTSVYQLCVFLPQAMRALLCFSRVFDAL